MKYAVMKYAVMKFKVQLKKFRGHYLEGTLLKNWEKESDSSLIFRYTITPKTDPEEEQPRRGQTQNISRNLKSDTCNKITVKVMGIKIEGVLSIGL
jgi:hypothetical protein